MPWTRHLSKSQRSLDFGCLQVFERVSGAFVRAERPWGALAGRELRQPSTVLGVGVGGVEHRWGCGWHEAVVYGPRSRLTRQTVKPCVSSDPICIFATKVINTKMFICVNKWRQACYVAALPNTAGDRERAGRGALPGGHP